MLTEPIHLVFLSAPGSPPTASHPRVLVWAGRKSQATIIESYGGPADAVYFTNAVSEITLEDGAVVDHYRLQRESARAFHIGTLCATQGRATSTMHFERYDQAPKNVAEEVIAKVQGVAK